MGDLETCFERGWLPMGLHRPGWTSTGRTDNEENRNFDFEERTQVSGAFPQCYGPDEFSQLPKLSQQLDESALEDMRARAAALAEATGRPHREAAEVLLSCDGDSEMAAQRLLAAAANERIAEQLAEATATTYADAVEALRACGGDDAAAAS